MRAYAKAYAGAITAILVFVAAEVGLQLPDTVTAALLTLITGGIVYAVRNRQQTAAVGMGGANLPGGLGVAGSTVQPDRPDGGGAVASGTEASARVTGGSWHGFWPVAALPYVLAADRVNTGEALFWIAVIIIVGCLVFGGYLIYLGRVAAGLALAVVALLAAIIFFSV